VFLNKEPFVASGVETAKNGWRLFEMAKEPKEFLEISGMHNEGFITSGKHYEGGLNAFISEWIDSNM